MEIVTHGGGEILYYILNAVAMITSGADFADLIVIALSFATIWIGFKAAFNLSSSKDTFIWLGTYLTLYTGLLLPKVDVIVTDKFDSTYVATVDNVPYGLAMIGSYTSAIGNGMAELFDQAFALPNDQSYSSTGFLFGNKVLRQATNIKIRDLEFSQNLTEFINQCVSYDIESANKYTYNDLFNTDDIWNFLTVENKQSEVWMFKYADNGNIEIVTCKEGSEKLHQKWDNEIEQDTLYLYERNFGKADSDAIAVSTFSSQLQDSNNFLMGISQDSTSILRQNLMINAINTAVDRNSEYSDLLAELQTKETHKRTASIAQKSVVLLRSVLEAIFYGIFPFVFLLFLLPGGIKVFMGYIRGFLWIQLWPILYAILHLVLMIGNQKSLGFVSGSMTLNQVTEIDEITQEIAIVAGYMMISIPPIAWALVSGMQSMGYAVGNFLGASTAAASAAAAESSRGNYSIGNSSFGNHSYNNISANKNNTSGYINENAFTHVNNDGSISTVHGDGSAKLDTSSKYSDLHTQMNVKDTISSSISSSASSYQQKAESLTQEASKSYASAAESAISMSEHYSQAKESGESWTKGVDANTHQALENLDILNKKYEAGASGEMKLFDMFGIKGGLNFGASISKDDQEIFKDSMETINKASQEGRFSITDSQGNSLNEAFNNSYTESQQKLESAAINNEKAQNLTQAAEKMKSFDLEVEQNLSHKFHQYLSSKSSPMEAADIMENPERRMVYAAEYSNWLENNINSILMNKEDDKLFAQVQSQLSNDSFGARSSELLSQEIVNNNAELAEKYHSQNESKIDNSSLIGEVKQDISNNNNQRMAQQSESKPQMPEFDLDKYKSFINKDD